MKKETRIATRNGRSRTGLDDKESLKRIGRTIKAVRAIRGWTQGDLARKVGASQNHICNVEMGKREPGILLLLALAKVLGVSIDLLVLPGMQGPAIGKGKEDDQIGADLRNLLIGILEDTATRSKEA
ncbi:MAG TPA: helix-turn-helix transcriptional regulator [Phycisphaerae bacterium]|nr:helix-turn-helix transcriptional regulator [Phycisphaerae bacterium]